MPRLNYELFFYALLGVNIAFVAFSAGKGSQKVVNKIRERNYKDED